MKFKWTEENMRAICDSLVGRTDANWKYKLYAVGFEDDSIALVHKGKAELADGWDDANECYINEHIGDYYIVSHLYPSSINGEPVVTDDDIESWSECGESPWEGDTQEYLEDKAAMEAEGRIYMQV
jgi:hypothetical protein